MNSVAMVELGYTLSSEEHPPGSDPEPFIESVEACVEAGYDYVYFHQIGPDQEGFFEFCEEHLAGEF